MPLIRGHHSFDNHFTQVPNDWLRDSRLTFKARGLLSLVMSHTQGWSLSINSLAAQNQEGKDAIRSAILELESCGYLSRSQTNLGGRFGETVWTTHDPADLPLTENPTTENPMTVNPTPKKNIYKEQQSKEEQNPRSARGHQLPNDWKPSKELVEMFATKWPDVNQALHTENFQLYWWSSGATKQRWDLTFQKWMNSEQDRAHKFNSRQSSYSSDRQEQDRLKKEWGQL